MDTTFLTVIVAILYVLWNEFGRDALRRRRNGNNPLDGEGDFDQRLRAIEAHLNREEGYNKSQREELKRTLARIEGEQKVQRERVHDLADKHLAVLTGRVDAMNERLLSMERWRYGTPDPMLPQGGDR